MMISTYTNHLGKTVHIGTVYHYATLHERVIINTQKAPQRWDSLVDDPPKMCAFCGVVELKPRKQENFCSRRCACLAMIGSRKITKNRQ